MKKFLLVLFAALCIVQAKSQLFSEHFKYAASTNPAADSLDDASFKTTSGILWRLHSGSGGSPLVVTPGLSYPKYYTDSVGKPSGKLIMAHGSGSRKDFNIGFAPQTSGNVYASFILNVTKLDTAATSKADYFIHFATRKNVTKANGTVVDSLFTVFPGRVFITKSKTPGKYHLGISKAVTPETAIVVDSTNLYSENQPTLVVLKYAINGTYVSAASSIDDSISLFSFGNGVAFPSVEPSVYIKNKDRASDAEMVNTICLRQGSSNQTQFEIDALRVGTSWAETVLPCSLQNFAAVAVQGQVNVNWQMCNELNIASYNIQKSSDGVNFTNIETQLTKGKSAVNHYSSVDKVTANTTAYYRVKINYVNGNTAYSSIAKVNTNQLIKLQVSPNPAKNFININAATPIKQVQLYSISGVAVLKATPNASSATLNVAHLPKGSYVIKAETNNSSVTQNIIIQ